MELKLSGSTPEASREAQLVWQHTDTKLYLSSCPHSVDEASHAFHELHLQLEFLQRPLGVCPRRWAFRHRFLSISDGLSRQESTLSSSSHHSFGMYWSQTNNDSNEWESTAFVVPRSDICVGHYLSTLVLCREHSTQDLVRFLQ